MYEFWVLKSHMIIAVLSDVKTIQWFYRQLGCSAFSLIFWPSKSLVTAQPQIGLFY